MIRQNPSVNETIETKHDNAHNPKINNSELPIFNFSVSAYHGINKGAVVIDNYYGRDIRIVGIGNDTLLERCNPYRELMAYKFGVPNRAEFNFSTMNNNVFYTTTGSDSVFSQKILFKPADRKSVV